MPELPADFDPAILLTMAGGTIAAGIVASVVETAKKLPAIGAWIDAKREPGVATIVSFLLIGYAYLVTHPTPDPVSAFGALIAAFGVAGLASKAHDVASDLRAGS